jgi:hypothetical protein
MSWDPEMIIVFFNINSSVPKEHDRLVLLTIVPIPFVGVVKRFVPQFLERILYLLLSIK